MKREDFLDSLEYIEDEYIEEADQTRTKEAPSGESGKITPIRRRPVSAVRWGTLVAGLAVLAVAAVALTGILKVRSGNMNAMKSAEVVSVEEQQALEYEAAETAGTAVEEDAAGAMTETAGTGAEEIAAEDMADEAAEEIAAEDMAGEVSEEPAVSSMAGGAVEEYAADDITETAAEEKADTAAEEPVGLAAADTEAEGYSVHQKADMYMAQAPAAGSENTGEREEAAAAEESAHVRVLSDAGEIVFALNDTPAAASLLSQLPLRAETEPYSDNEIVFHPEKPLDTENGTEGGGTAGYLGYYAPWNNVVLYYGDFDAYPGLYILGEAVSGAEHIKDIRGEISIEQ